VVTTALSLFRRGFLGPLTLGIFLFPITLQAGISPWWEHYEIKQIFRCGDSSELLLEHNDHQASLYHQGYKSNLFRDQKAFALKRYANERLSVVLNGDELIIEDLLSKTRCQRTEQV